MTTGSDESTVRIRLVLSAATVLSPATDFPTGIRERLGGADDDVVLSRRRARAGSVRINAETAEFLRLFDRPRTIVEATIAHARRRGLDPEALLDEAFGLVLQLREQRILVPSSEAVESIAGAQFEPGEVVFGLRIDECRHRLADTEVYLAADPAGRRMALKYVLADAPDYVKEALANEVRVLGLAKEAGVVVADPSAWELDRPDPYLVMDWLDGTTLDAMVGADALLAPRRSRVARALTEAYRAIHRLGVIHGDVHPGNVLVDGVGQVHLVDFGAATLAGMSGGQRRLGLVAHYEPEVAVAALAGTPIPPATAQGEQYTVAALLFLVLTGSTPIVLALETRRSLEEIAAEPPRTFAELGVGGSSIEPVLRRALAKAPDDRYPSLEAFAASVLGALDADEAQGGAVVVQATRRPSQLLPIGLDAGAAQLHRAYGLNSGLIRRGLADGPRASIYHGASGLSLAFLRLALTGPDPEALAAARVWLAWAQQMSATSEGFTSRRLNITPSDIGPGSILHGRSGLHLTACLVRHALGDQTGAGAELTAFVDHAMVSMGPWSSDLFGDDLANGSAGLLLGFAALRTAAQSSGPDLHARWLNGGLACANEVAARLGESGDAPGATDYLGMAHGTAGRAYALLRWRDVSGALLQADAARALEDLAERARVAEGRARWPVRRTSGGIPWSGWCHGSAGYVLLWSLAHEVLGDHAYADLALMAGEDVWAARDASGPSLCCGLAGQAIVLADLGRRTGLSAWTARGQTLAKAAMRARIRPKGRGLFKGEAGPITAALETTAEVPQFPISGTSF